MTMRSQIDVFSSDGLTLLFCCSRNRARRLIDQGQAVWWHRKVSLKAKTLDIKEKMTRSLATKLYGNCRVLSPEGDIMFHCNMEKIDWYLSRNLADVVQQNPYTIQLKFEPNGPGHVGDPYYLTEKKNQCVVCGVEKELTRHHVMPWCYRRYMPAHVKDHSYHDILLLCVNCHEKYEDEASKLKQEIGVEYGIPMHGRGMYYDHQIARVAKHAAALYRHGKMIPPERRKMLLKTVQDHYGHEDVTDDELKAAMKLESHIMGPDFITHGEYVVQRLTDLEAFTKRWRWHFLETMDPQFMPEHWDVDRSIYREDNQPGYNWKDKYSWKGNCHGPVQIPPDAPPAVEPI
jgi:hypothetical protein